MRRGEELVATVAQFSVRVWKQAMSNMMYTGCEMLSVVTIIVLACFIGRS